MCEVSNEVFFMPTIAASKQCAITSNVKDNVGEEIENQQSEIRSNIETFAEERKKLADYERKFKELYGSGNDKIQLVPSDDGHISIVVNETAFDNYRIVNSGHFIQFFTSEVDRRIDLPLHAVRTEVALTIDVRVGGVDHVLCSSRTHIAHILDFNKWKPGPIFKICQAGVVPVKKDWKKVAKPPAEANEQQ
jgi:hypothetical protein